MKSIKNILSLTLVCSSLVLANSAFAEDTVSSTTQATEQSTHAEIKVTKPATVEESQVGDEVYVSEAANVW